MAMVFCRGCGKEIHETAPTCPHCGAPQIAVSSISESGAIQSDVMPDGIKGWSWGAFLLSWIWAIGNKTWIGLLAIIPYVGFIMAIILGFKGREWAWKNKQWDSVEHFNRVQKKWSVWGVWLVVVFIFVGIVLAIAIPAYSDYQQRAVAAKVAQEEIQAQQEAQAQLAAQMESQKVEAQRLDELPWPEEFKSNFYSSCVESAAPKVNAERASTYCACVTNKLSVEVPASLIEQSVEEIKAAAADC